MQTAREQYRIIVTGSRAWPDELVDYVTEKLMLVVGGAVDVFRTVVVVHGACILKAQPPGTTPVDQVVDAYVRRSPYFTGGDRGHPYLDVEAHPADWEIYGPAAGPRRNDEMVKSGARKCLAFPDETAMRGTSDCFMRAIRAGIPTEVYPLADARRWMAERRAIEASS